MESIDVRGAWRLALCSAGLLAPQLTGMPKRARGAGKRARRAALEVVERFGYLQLDTVAIAGARSHCIVLASRLEGLDASIGETLLRPREPLFEYWGHEACWMPLSMYPWFEFRRREFRVHPWWGDLLGAHAKLAREIVARIRGEGPLRSLDLEGRGGQGWWDLKLTRRVAEALWSAGDLAVRERRNFQRTFDLRARVIPDELAAVPCPEDDAYERLLLRALDGHGWAATGTLAATWRLSNRRPALDAALERLRERGDIVACALQAGPRRLQGWIRPAALELTETLRGLRPRRSRAVLLSPFDPVLWDRRRLLLLGGFEQVLEIYKPAPQRRFGYFVLPVLAGTRLIGRVDLKAERRGARLHVLARHFESAATGSTERALQCEALEHALARFAGQVGLTV